LLDQIKTCECNSHGMNTTSLNIYQ